MRVRAATPGVVVLVGVVVVAFAGRADAVVPDASAVLNGPFGTQVAAGTTIAVTAEFSLGSDVGPVIVSVELQNANGLGTFAVDATNTTSELLNCDDSTGIVISCDWDGLSANSPQTLAFTLAIDATAPPNQGWSVVAFVDSLADVDPPQQLTNAEVFIGPPAGSTTLSGQVITDGGAAVEAACIFVLSEPYVFPVVADAQGQWSLSGLPDTYEFAVAAVAPFVGTFGPCLENGPPPIPGPGDLQPVFYDDIWIDLSDPNLTGGLQNPYTYAIAHGATLITDSLAGIVSCLTTAPANVVPRPACIQVAATTTIDAGTTTTSLAATTTTLLAGGTPTTATTAPQLAATGSESSTWMPTAAMMLIAFGALSIIAARRHRTPHA